MTLIKRKPEKWEIGIENGVPYLRKVKERKKESLQEVVDLTEIALRERGELEEAPLERPNFSGKPSVEQLYQEVLERLPPFLRIKFTEPTEEEKYKEGAPDWLPFKVGDTVCTRKEYNTKLTTLKPFKGEIAHLETNGSGGNSVATVIVNGKLEFISCYWLEKCG